MFGGVLAQDPKATSTGPRTNVLTLERINFMPLTLADVDLDGHKTLANEARKRERPSICD